MPSFSTVEVVTRCLGCGRALVPPAGVVGFVWGGTPEHYRRLDDEIRWYVDDNGVVPSMRLIRGGKRLRFNFGEPGIPRVLVFEGDPHIQDITCSRCGEHYETLAVEIVDNRLDSVRLFRDGETQRLYARNPGELAVVELGPHGSVRVRDDLFDPPFETS